MKQFATAVLLISFILGCAPTKRTIQGGGVIHVLDFTDYSNRGFLFTPEKYSGNYESIGLIEFDYMATANCEEVENQITSTTYVKWVPEPYSIKDGLDQVYDEVIKLGGNAIMNLDITYLEPTDIYYNCPENNYFPGGYKIQGFAIKRVSN